MSRQQFDLRPATQADRSAVVDVWQAAGLTVAHNPHEVDFDRAVAGPSSDVLIAETEGRICGTVMVGEDGHRAWVYYLAVADQERRQGLGRRLMDAAEDWARARGVRKLQLMIRPSNTAVRDFYAEIGFAETPRLVMAKWLDKEMAHKRPEDRDTP